MFESIAIRPHGLFRPEIDLGGLAECLFYYRRVHLLLSTSALKGLIKRAGLSTVLALVESGFVDVILFKDVMAVYSDGRPGRRLHDFVICEPLRMGSEDSHSPLEIVESIIFSVTNRRMQSKRAAYRFLDSSKLRGVNTGIAFDGGLTEAARKDVEDLQYVRRSIGTILEQYTGGTILADWKFDISRNENGLRIDTNIDFVKVSQLATAHHGRSIAVTEATLLNFFNEARFDLFYSAHLKSEMLTNSISSALIRERVGGLIEASGMNSLDKIHQFHDFLLEGRRISEAVRSGHKSLDQVLVLAERAAKFRNWVFGLPFDSSLAAEYGAALTRGTWSDKLRTKIMRFSIFTGIGVGLDMALVAPFSTVGGVILGTLDTYCADRLFNGWAPNQFVEKELAPFLK